jgi:Domain of unknown function (DUF4249)
MNKTICLIIMTVVLIACETVVDIDVPIEERILVVNALNNPDSTWRVRLSLSRHVLDDVPYKVPADASVSIYDAGTNELIEQLTTSPNAFFYSGVTKPVPGKPYLLRVMTAKYGNAESSMTLPEAVQIKNVEVDSIPRMPGGGGPISPDDSFPVKISFKDPTGVANYYKVSASARSWYLRMVDQVTDTIWYDYPIFLKVKDPSLQAEYNVNGPLFFDDSLFDGDERILTVGIQSYNFYYNNTTQIKVVLSSLSESFYRYATTTNLQHATNGDPFAQPVLVYNNIQHGLGIFGGFTQSVWVVKK